MYQLCSARPGRRQLRQRKVHNAWRLARSLPEVPEPWHVAAKTPLRKPSCFRPGRLKCAKLFVFAVQVAVRGSAARSFGAGQLRAEAKVLIVDCQLLCIR